MGPRVLGAAFLVFALGVIAALAAFFRYDDAYDWVEHTSDVRLAIGRAIDHTGPVFECNAVREDVQQVAELTADNPQQQLRLPAVSASVSAACAGQRSPHLVDELADLDATERDLLVLRRARLARVRAWALLAFIGSLLGAGAIAVWSAWLQQRALRRLGESEERFRMLAAHASDLLRIHDVDGRCTWASPSSERLLGYTPEEIVAMPPIVQLGHPDDMIVMKAELARIHAGGAAGMLRYRMRAKTGDYRWFETYSDPQRDRHGKLVRFFTTARDITERVEAQQALEQLAITDELTGLLNRRGFTLVAGQQHRIALRQRVGLAIVFADLDGLKRINDQLGHDHGDRAIRELAEVLRATFRDSDVLARLGGDEYAVLAYDVDRARVDTVLARLRAEVDAKNTGERAFRLAVSLGVAVLDPEAPRSLDELIGEADQRMYDQKQARGGRRAG